MRMMDYNHRKFQILITHRTTNNKQLLVLTDKIVTSSWAIKSNIYILMTWLRFNQILMASRAHTVAVQQVEANNLQILMLKLQILQILMLSRLQLI